MRTPRGKPICGDGMKRVLHSTGKSEAPCISPQEISATWITEEQLHGLNMSWMEVQREGAPKWKRDVYDRMTAHWRPFYGGMGCMA